MHVHVRVKHTLNMPMGLHPAQQQMKNVPKNQKPSPPVQIDMYLVQHVQHAIPVIHTVMVGLLTVAVVIKTQLNPEHKPHVLDLITVLRIHVEHVKPRIVITGIIIVQRIQPVPPRTATNQWPVLHAIRDIIHRGQRVLHVRTSQQTVHTPAQHRQIHVHGHATVGIIRHLIISVVSSVDLASPISI